MNKDSISSYRLPRFHRRGRRPQSEQSNKSFAANLVERQNRQPRIAACLTTHHNNSRPPNQSILLIACIEDRHTVTIALTMSTTADTEATATAETAPVADEASKENADTNTAAAPEKKAADKGSKPPPTAVEFEPPLACVRRLLKHSLPSSTNVGKDASTAFARASGIFIIYLTACANDFARENRRQTITANDVLAAMKVR